PTTPLAQDKQELAAAVKQKATHDASTGLSVLDVLRIAGGILLLSSGLSYLSTSGTSMTWGYNPWWTRAREWKALMNPPLHLTDADLAKYDGTNPTLPIYLALNGTIYDVSAGRSTYGPGGSYHFFAGRDSARAFLTGCFATDITPDLRGVEEMFIPVDPETKPDAAPEVLEKASKRRVLSSGELKNRRAVEMRRARQLARDGLENWHRLFRGDKGKPYFKVGEVVREEGWADKSVPMGLCEQAEKGRPVRKYD
ncbi:cytochrome b5, partial [Dothidotthia symphoricarpi CBS 119687]